ncbi:MAG: hypothetical protein JSV94_06905, partial [Methanobacteriota archaeon]
GWSARLITGRSPVQIRLGPPLTTGSTSEGTIFAVFCDWIRIFRTASNALAWSSKLTPMYRRVMSVLACPMTDAMVSIVASNAHLSSK